jgi:hypothetical protein
MTASSRTRPGTEQAPHDQRHEYARSWLDEDVYPEHGGA